MAILRGQSSRNQWREWRLAPSLSQWPKHQQAHDELTLKSFAEQMNGRRTECSIQHSVLTLHITQRVSRDSPCAGRRKHNTVTGTPVKVPLTERGVMTELGVGLKRGRGDLFTIDTLHEQSMHDDETAAPPTSRPSETSGSRSWSGWASQSSTPVARKYQCSAPSRFKSISCERFRFYCHT